MALLVPGQGGLGVQHLATVGAGQGQGGAELVPQPPVQLQEVWPGEGDGASGALEGLGGLRAGAAVGEAGVEREARGEGEVEAAVGALVGPGVGVDQLVVGEVLLPAEEPAALLAAAGERSGVAAAVLAVLPQQQRVCELLATDRTLLDLGLQGPTQTHKSLVTTPSRSSHGLMGLHVLLQAHHTSTSLVTNIALMPPRLPRKLHRGLHDILYNRLHRRLYSTLHSRLHKRLLYGLRTGLQSLHLATGPCESLHIPTVLRSNEAAAEPLPTEAPLINGSQRIW